MRSSFSLAKWLCFFSFGNRRFLCRDGFVNLNIINLGTINLNIFNLIIFRVCQVRFNNSITELYRAAKQINSAYFSFNIQQVVQFYLISKLSCIAFSPDQYQRVEGQIVNCGSTRPIIHVKYICNLAFCLYFFYFLYGFLKCDCTLYYCR